MMDHIADQAKEENWLIFGDFNEVLCVDERRGLGIRTNSGPGAFCGAVERCEIKKCVPRLGILPGIMAQSMIGDQIEK